MQVFHDSLINIEDSNRAGTCIVINGDFNARDGSMNNDCEDMVENSNLFTTRNSLDSKINKRDKMLVMLMEQNEFLLCNGRSLSDSIVNYRYMSKAGKSTIDLCWINNLGFQLIKDFNIYNVCEESDNMLIYMGF